MSLNGTTGNCALEDYPEDIKNPSAMVYTNGAVLACGGRELEAATRCWRFDSSTWSPLSNSSEGHCARDSPSVMVNDGWWVTGRTHAGYNKCTDSPTSELYDGQSWIPGPALPQNEYDKFSCVANLNTTHTMIIGGYYASSDAWLYNWRTLEWTQTDSLISGRRVHGCVSLGDQGVLVAGGSEDHTVELYDPVLGTWSTQPSLPEELDPIFPTLLNWEGQVLALIYQEEEIYQRSNETGEWSVLEGVRLPEDFDGYDANPAVLVPDNWPCNPVE